MGWIKTTQHLPREGQVVEVWHNNRLVRAMWNGKAWQDEHGCVIDVMYWRKINDM